MWRPHSMLEGILMENCAGTLVAKSLIPIGSAPTTVTLLKDTPAGDATKTVTAWPGFTIVPSTGELICSSGWFCWATPRLPRIRITVPISGIREFDTMEYAFLNTFSRLAEHGCMQKRLVRGPTFDPHEKPKSERHARLPKNNKRNVGVTAIKGHGRQMHANWIKKPTGCFSHHAQ